MKDDYLADKGVVRTVAPLVGPGSTHPPAVLGTAESPAWGQVREAGLLALSEERGVDSQIRQKYSWGQTPA